MQLAPFRFRRGAAPTLMGRPNNDGRAREDEMKIDAVELTLFSWDDIPPTRYTPGSQNVTGRSNLGLLRIATDEGIEGHALLGSAFNPGGDRCRRADPISQTCADGQRPART